MKISDMAAEVELFQEKYLELKHLAEGLQSAAPTSMAKQRVCQRLHHLSMRLQNLETQAGSTEMETTLTSLRDQVAAALQEPPRSQHRPTELNPRPPSLEEENKLEQAASPLAFSGMGAACYHKPVSYTHLFGFFFKLITF